MLLSCVGYVILLSNVPIVINRLECPCRLADNALSSSSVLFETLCPSPFSLSHDRTAAMSRDQDHMVRGEWREGRVWLCGRRMRTRQPHRRSPLALTPRC